MKIDWKKPVSKRTQLTFDYIVIFIFATMIYLVVVSFFIPLLSESHDFSTGQEQYNYIMSWEFMLIGIKFMIGFAVIVFGSLFIYLFSFNFYLTWTDRLENLKQR